MSRRYTCYAHPTMGSWGYLQPRGAEPGSIVAIDKEGNWDAQAFRQPTKLANELRRKLTRGYRAMPEPMYLQTYLEAEKPKARFVAAHPDLLIDKISMGGCSGLFYVALRPEMVVGELVEHLREVLSPSDKPGYSARRDVWLKHVAACTMYVPALNSGPADILALGQWARFEQLVVTPFTDQPSPPEGMPSISRQSWRKYLTSVWDGDTAINEAFTELGWPLSELFTAQPADSTFETEAGGW